jgi:hypothetical protein
MVIRKRTLPLLDIEPVIQFIASDLVGLVEGQNNICTMPVAVCALLL